MSSNVLTKKVSSGTPFRFGWWDKDNVSKTEDVLSLFSMHNPNMDLTEEKLLRFAGAGHGFLLMYAGSRPIGYVWFNYLDPQKSALATLEYFIRPEERGRGLSKRLIIGLGVLLRRRGILNVDLVHHNRQMVRQGLSILRQGKKNRAKIPGLKSAFSVKRGKRWGPYRDVSIRIHPRKRAG